MIRDVAGRHGLDRFVAAYRTGDRLLADPVWQVPEQLRAA